MAQPTHLQNLFADLKRFGQHGEYERALKTSNKILQEAHEDEKAFHCKIVCLLQLGRFDDALNHINKNQKLSCSLTFEKAYSEYRLNRTKDALKTLQALPNPSDREKELLGQVLYRLEDYSKCFDVYCNLVKNTQDDYEEERETNLSAVMAALRMWSGKDVDDIGLSEATYELSYNNACFLIGRGDYKGALDKLKKAEELCRESLEDDAEAMDDIDAELGIIRVQKGYVLQRLGHNDEALKLYNQVLKNKPLDPALSAVASNNTVTINKDQNVFDSKKKMKVAIGDGLQQKLTSPQRQSISLNQSLLYMYMNQGDQCHLTAKSLQQKHPGLNTPVLIDAAQYVRDKQMPAAIDTLKKRMSSGNGSVDMKLTLCQLYLLQGSVYSACEVLQDLGALTHKPGVVSTLVTLYLSQEDTEQAITTLEEAVSWYEANQPASDELRVLIQSQADFLIAHGTPQQATVVLEQLHKHNKSDQKVLAQLISAYAKFDPLKAQEVSRSLPSQHDTAQEVDVEALEATVSTLGPKYIKKTLGGKTENSPKPTSPTGAGDASSQLKQKRKKKKGKLPKNCDTTVDPDPERWLPRRERSYFKGKRRDKRKDIGKGTQGSSASATSELDASKTATPSASGSEVGSPRPGRESTPGAPPPRSAPAPTVPAGPRGSKPSSKPSKKKKKGGKW